MIRLYVAATVALLAGQACGSARSTHGPTHGPTPQRPDPDGSASTASKGSAGHLAPDAGSGAHGERASVEHPSDRECDALFAHALAVEQEQRPIDQRLGEPELVRLRATLHEQKLPACLELSRATVRCMVAAPTLAALTSCS